MLWWVAQNAIIATVLAGIVASVCRLGRINPAVRHALWLVVLLKLLTPPLVLWPWAIPDLRLQGGTETHHLGSPTGQNRTGMEIGEFILIPTLPDSAALPVGAEPVAVTPEASTPLFAVPDAVGPSVASATGSGTSKRAQGATAHDANGVRHQLATPVDPWAAQAAVARFSSGAATSDMLAGCHRPRAGSSSTA